MSFELCLMRNLMHRQLPLKFQSARLQYLAFSTPYVRKCQFLIIFHVMGLATAVSIQLDPAHSLPNMF